MKYFRLITLGIILGFVVALPSFVRAEENAVDMSPTYRAVSANCSILKTTIKQVEINDSVYRVNFGRNYELILKNVMIPANARLVSQGYNASDLIIISFNLESELQSFRDMYLVHKNNLSDLANEDCSDTPDRFYSDLGVVRTDKRNLRAQLEKMYQLASDYKLKLGEVLNNGPK